MTSLRKLLSTIAGVVLVSLAVGCGALPTAPNESASRAQTVATAVPQSPESSALLGGLGDLVGDVLRLLVRTLDLVGSLGGSLTNGRWKVEIPANAVQGNATVSMGVASPAATDCQLEIVPASKNHFETPVTLTVDCRGVSDRDLRGYVIHWYNPDTRTWVPVQGSRVDLSRKTVSAPLQHFSRYCVGPTGGKGGW